MPTLSVVIPVFNSEQSLTALHQELSRVLNAFADAYEIIFVEDCGTDNSWQTIESLCSADTHARGIKLSRNYGQHNALLCGIRAAQHEVIVTIDDDLQNPPEEIPKLLAELELGADVVYGTPQTMQHGLFRNLASRLTKLALQSVMGAEVASQASAFRAFRTRLRQGFCDFKGPFVSIDVLLTWSTSRFAAVNVRHEARQVGKSNYTLGKLVRHALDLMTGFTTLPLQFASYLGFTLTLFGLGVLVWVVARYFIIGTSIPGFPFLASIIAIFSGAQLFALGIFGEYLARMHFRSMDRPAYTVWQKSGPEPMERKFL